MFINKHLDQFGGKHSSSNVSFNATGFIDKSEFILLNSSEPAFRHRVHVIAHEAQQRAMMARLIFALGHHAEVYSDVNEMIEHSPAEGIVLVHEYGQFGAVDVCQSLTAHGLWLPVIGFGVEVDACRIVAGVKAGALDYIVGQMTADVVLAKLQQCAEEAPSISEIRGRRAKARSLISKLSIREREVLSLVSSGLSNKGVARNLGISPRTVEIHRMKMMGKIGAISSAQAVRLQIEANEL
jgi:two-component system response regulator FixJ